MLGGVNEIVAQRGNNERVPTSQGADIAFVLDPHGMHDMWLETPHRLSRWLSLKKHIRHINRSPQMLYLYREWLMKRARGSF
jgi:hypothetical protein